MGFVIVAHLRFRLVVVASIIVIVRRARKGTTKYNFKIEGLLIPSIGVFILHGEYLRWQPLPIHTNQEFPRVSCNTMLTSLQPLALNVLSASPTPVSIPREIVCRIKRYLEWLLLRETIRGEVEIPNHLHELTASIF